MKKKRIIVISIILIIIVIVAAIAILYFTTDLFKSREQLFWKYFSQSIDLTEMISNDKYILQSNFKQNNSYTGSGIISFVKEQGENSSKQFNIATTSRHDATTGRTYTDATLKNGELDLLKASYINSGDIYGIKCDEIFPNYIGIQNSGLKQLASNHQLENAESLPDSINIENYTNLFTLTEEQKTHLQDVYLPIIMNNIPKDSYVKTTEQITVNNAIDSSVVSSYNANVYSVEISGENLKTILVSILNTLKSDTQTLIDLSGVFSKFGMGTDYTDTSNLSARISELINAVQNSTFDEGLSIKVYESGRELIRVSMEMENEFEFTYDREEAQNTIILDIYNESITNETEETQQENVDENEIIDLNNVATSQNATENISRIILNKNITDSNTSNTLQIIPNINNVDNKINVIFNMGQVQNNSYSNSIMLEIGNSSGEVTERTRVEYNNTVSSASEVEEIEELTSSNTAIANNYNADAFRNFAQTWFNLLKERIAQNMITLGFEEFAGI